mmetsp:Transcript_15793/g.45147  ORF Transcript_15793/g.45147 Transcript_15793/m.45147 type:complete len:242 (-) Transcript_15793:1937-2662(-)
MTMAATTNAACWRRRSPFSRAMNRSRRSQSTLVPLEATPISSSHIRRATRGSRRFRDTSKPHDKASSNEQKAVFILASAPQPASTTPSGVASPATRASRRDVALFTISGEQVPLVTRAAMPVTHALATANLPLGDAEPGASEEIVQLRPSSSARSMFRYRSKMSNAFVWINSASCTSSSDVKSDFFGPKRPTQVINMASKERLSTFISPTHRPSRHSTKKLITSKSNLHFVKLNRTVSVTK